MGKKKRNHPDVDEVVNRPWCYYCERDFDDLKILINHQKAKHFKCERCGRRLNTAGGLNVHMTQVHKETLTQVENALPNRQGLDCEIFGMEGIPADIIATHQQRVLQQFYEAQAERAAATGNPQPGISGGQGQSAPKKAKFESPSDLKKRLAEHKAKKAAEAAGGSSGNVTPLAAPSQGGQSPAMAQSPLAYPQAGSPAYGAPFSAPQGSPPQSAYAQPFGQPPYAPQSSPYPPQPPFAQPSPFSQQPGYGGPPGQPFPPPVQKYPPPGGQQFPAPYNAPFPYAPSQSPTNRTPPSNGQQRSGSLPTAPGLPQRPSFGVPQVNAFQMQQMHQGHLPPNGQPGGAAEQSNGQGQQQTNTEPSGDPGFGASLDELISSAKGAGAKPTEATEAAPEKKPKKEKQNVRLVYSDSEVSPEEKMARLPRYAFNPENRQEEVLADVSPNVTGVVDDQATGM